MARVFLIEDDEQTATEIVEEVGALYASIAEDRLLRLEVHAEAVPTVAGDLIVSDRVVVPRRGFGGEMRRYHT